MNCADMTPFKYDKIDTNQFRVLLFEDNDCLPELHLRLVAAPLLHKRPAYEAISYVWGDASETKTVIMNNKSKSVSRSLFQILTLLRRRLTKQRMFWIDALCINQEDNVEKGFQIPAMGPIYKFADLVHIFPGQDYSDTAVLTAQELLRISDRLAEKPPPGTIITHAFLESKRIPSRDDFVWSKFREFFQLPWFQRLWVVQEAVLADELVMHFSDEVVSWTQLMDLINRLGYHKLLQSYINVDVSASYCRQSIPRRATGYQAAQLIDNVKDPYLHQYALFVILHIVRQKLCRDAVDRVYAWMWLLSESMRANVTPRYLTAAETPLNLIYLEFNHIALAEHRNLACLQMTCTLQRIPFLPSWCINLQSDSETSSYITSSCKAGGEILTPTGPHFASSRRGNRIYLRGLETCQIAGIFAPRWLDCEGATIHPDCAASWLSWFTDCMGYVKSNCIEAEHLLRTLVLDGLRDNTEYPVIFTDLLSYYQDLTKYWSQWATGTASGAVELGSVAIVRVTRIKPEFKRANMGRRLLVTSLNTLCLGHHTAKVGDRVCVFEGARAPLLLRQKETESDVYTLVSDAWVLGLMNGEAFQKNTPEQTFIVE